MSRAKQMARIMERADRDVAVRAWPRVKLPVGCVDFVEAMVELGSLEHTLSIYSKSLAKRADGDGCPFYSQIVEQQLEGVARIKSELERALKEFAERDEQ